MKICGRNTIVQLLRKCVPLTYRPVICEQTCTTHVEAGYVYEGNQTCTTHVEAGYVYEGNQTCTTHV